MELIGTRPLEAYFHWRPRFGLQGTSDRESEGANRQAPADAVRPLLKEVCGRRRAACAPPKRARRCTKLLWPARHAGGAIRADLGAFR